MRTIEITESKAATLDLTTDEANAVRHAGVQLASDKGWWGSAAENSDSGPARTVIAVDLVSEGRWRIRVRDAVGVIGLPNVQIQVVPKIPANHLFHLMEVGGYVPRLADAPAMLEHDRSLWRLVAKWYLSEAEMIVRRDLMRGYEQESRILPLIRGRIDALETARLHYAGRLQYPCEYDNFTIDIALNRVLRTAARVVAASPVLERRDRRRAKAILSRMQDIGELRDSDLRAQSDRTTAHYSAGINLAHHIIRGHGRALQAGSKRSWTFLMRTPEAVESGILEVLRTGLSPTWSVAKKGRQIVGSSMTFNPDLVFDGGAATGDVKYKLSTGDLGRGDLYQAIAFATIYRTSHAAIVGFRATAGATPPTVSIGDLMVSHIDWNCDESLPPAIAASQLVADVNEWLVQRIGKLQVAI